MPCTFVMPMHELVPMQGPAMQQQGESAKARLIGSINALLAGPATHPPTCRRCCRTGCMTATRRTSAVMTVPGFDLPLQPMQNTHKP